MTLDIMLGVIIIGLGIVVSTLILIHLLILIPISLLSNLSFSTLFCIAGIISFLLSLAVMSILTTLSIHPDEKHKRRKSFILDRKEIRRSIAITFTILYILLLTFYFREVESAAQATSVLKTFVNETVTNETANSSFTTITIINKTTNLTGNNLTGAGLTQHNSLMSAFTALYTVIIGFYFGSRAYEKIKELKDAEEVLKLQYIMDEIDSDVFKKKLVVLRGLKPNAQLEIIEPITSEKKKITIKHKGGDAIYLKDIMVIIKVSGKKCGKKIDLAQYVSSEAYFKVTDVMVIDLKEGTITVDNENILKEEYFKKEYFFSWEDISEKNSEKLKKILEEDPRTKLVGTVTCDPVVGKNKKTVRVGKKKITFTLDEENKKVTMEIEGGETYEYILKGVPGKWSIYKKDFHTDALTRKWKPEEEIEVDVVYKPTKEIISSMEKQTIDSESN